MKTITFKALKLSMTVYKIFRLYFVNVSTVFQKYITRKARVSQSTRENGVLFLFRPWTAISSSAQL